MLFSQDQDWSNLAFHLDGGVIGDCIGMPALCSAVIGEQIIVSRFILMAFFCLCLRSTESGVDNPFRPDGDLSREADELLELLKGGRPISEAFKSRTGEPQPQEETQQSSTATDLSAVPEQNALPANGTPVKEDVTDAVPKVGSVTNGSTSPSEDKKVASPVTSPTPSNSVEVQHVIVPPIASENQVEHVVIKKKPKCQCCVIQ